MRKSSLGIPLFEHAAAIVVAVLVIWGVSAYLDLQLEQAEATVVSTTIMNIRSGLRTEKALRVASGRPVAIVAGTNPVGFLQIPPAGYIAADTIRNEISPGTWFYQQNDQTLYYRPRYSANLRLAADRVPIILGWKIAEVPGAPKETDLVSVTPYKWF